MGQTCLILLQHVNPKKEAWDSKARTSGLDKPNIGLDGEYSRIQSQSRGCSVDSKLQAVNPKTTFTYFLK